MNNSLPSSKKADGKRSSLYPYDVAAPRKKTRKLQHKRFIRRVVFVLLTLGISVAGWRYYQMHLVIQRQIEATKIIQQEIEQIKLENQRLKREIEQTGSPEYLERVAREDFGMIKDGEQIVIIDSGNGE